MFFLRPIRSDALDLPATMHVFAAPSNGMLVCPPLVWPAQQSVETWQAIYRLAYEQLVSAFAPSPFQRALEPSLN